MHWLSGRSLKYILSQVTPQASYQSFPMSISNVNQAQKIIVLKEYSIYKFSVAHRLDTFIAVMAKGLNF